MPRIVIDDLDDPRIASYRHLKATNLTRHGHEFVVEGATLVERLLTSGFAIASVLTTDRFSSRLETLVPPEVPTFVVPHEQIGDLVGFRFHRGILACGIRRESPDLATLLERAGARATIVVCPTLDNPENLGAILRSADAFGTLAVLVGPRCPDPLTRRVIRVSMGAALRLPVLTPNDLPGIIDILRDHHGFRIIAAVAKGEAEAIEQYRRPDRVALLLGGEAFGLDDAWLALADEHVTIPMRPGADSLNVAVAAGIFLHTLRCERPS
jgi:tRNA G18 (ribose-2'-O)-methylase SpoU